MATLYLRNVPEDLASRLDSLARRESMSVNTFAVRELTQAVAWRANADLLWSRPTLDVEVSALVDAVRTGRDR